MSSKPPSLPSASSGAAGAPGVTAGRVLMELRKWARTTQTPSSRAPRTSSSVAPPVFMIQPARTDPTHAPRLLPTPTSGKIRLPCSGVKMSLAKAQNWAITMTLKMPTHRK